MNRHEATQLKLKEAGTELKAKLMDAILDRTVEAPGQYKGNLDIIWVKKGKFPENIIEHCKEFDILEKSPLFCIIEDGEPNKTEYQSITDGKKVRLLDKIQADAVLFKSELLKVEK